MKRRLTEKRKEKFLVLDGRGNDRLITKKQIVYERTNKKDKEREKNEYNVAGTRRKRLLLT